MTAECYRYEISQYEKEAALARLEDKKEQAHWSFQSPLGKILSTDFLNIQHPTELMADVPRLMVSEQELYGYLFDKYPHIANRYDFNEATHFAKTSKAGRKLRRDRSNTSEGHLNIATILAAEFTELANEPVTQSYLIKAQFHDCLEDGDWATIAEIARCFGDEIAADVVLLSKKGSYLYISDSAKAVKIGIRQGIRAMSRQSEALDDVQWPQLPMNAYISRLRECDIKLQLIKLADRAANLLTDWNRVVHGQAGVDYKIEKKIEYIEETRKLILPAFIEDPRLAGPIQYILKICYEIEKNLSGTEQSTDFAYYSSYWLKQMAELTHQTGILVDPNRPL